MKCSSSICCHWKSCCGSQTSGCPSIKVLVIDPGLGCCSYLGCEILTVKALFLFFASLTWKGRNFFCLRAVAQKVFPVLLQKKLTAVGLSVLLKKAVILQGKPNVWNSCRLLYLALTRQGCSCLTWRDHKTQFNWNNPALPVPQ